MVNYYVMVIYYAINHYKILYINRHSPMEASLRRRHKRLRGKLSHERSTLRSDPVVLEFLLRTVEGVEFVPLND